MDAIRKACASLQQGTVVDKKICCPTEFDFYLCSRAGITGTFDDKQRGPTTKNQIHSFSADGLQMLTHNLYYLAYSSFLSYKMMHFLFDSSTSILCPFGWYYMQGERSDAGSSGRTRDRPVEVQHLPLVKDNVKVVMFSC
ncbi:unnamed protein product [Musa banksii]